MAVGDIPSGPHAAAPQPIDIAAWTEQATVALSSVAISAPEAVLQGTSVQFNHDAPPATTRPSGGAAAAKDGAYYRRNDLLRRDSLKRREAVLKGKEGSRRRQRWENDRLLNNPHAEPPLPHDWEIHPTHRVRHVPYYLAPLWDERKTLAVTHKAAPKTVAYKPTSPGVVPKELREKIKRSRGAKGLLMDLEGEVRQFVASWDAKAKQAELEGLPVLDSESEDDEIVFVGRNGQMSDDVRSSAAADVKKELMLFETPEEDVGGSFGRWLVHHIGVYYGLNTWSVTIGNPARRGAYIGLKGAKMKSGNDGQLCVPLPRPLYGLV